MRELARGGGSNPTPAAREALARARLGEPTGATTFATTDRRTSVLPPRRRPVALVAVAASAGVVIVVGGIALLSMGRPNPKPAMPPAAESAPLASQPPALPTSAPAPASASAEPTSAPPSRPKTSPAVASPPPATLKPKFGNPYGR